MPARSDAAVVVAIAASITAIDQLTKAAVISAIGPLRPESRINFGNGWIALEYAENRGAAFGLFRGLAPVIVAVSVAIVVGLLVHHFRETSPPLLSTFGIGAIVGGALGNLIDRFRLGFVVDFVSVGPWPNFNVADSAITIGVLALIWGWMQPGNEVSSSNAG